MGIWSTRIAFSKSYCSAVNADDISRCRSGYPLAAATQSMLRIVDLSVAYDADLFGSKWICGFIVSPRSEHISFSVFYVQQL